MLDKLVAFFKLPREYGNTLKIVWTGDELEVINYGFLMNYLSGEIIFSKVRIIGEGLKLLYQDPNVVKIKGKIKGIEKGEN